MPSNFEKLDAFKEAVTLSVLVYKITDSFPKEERYGLTSQVRRAATSVARHLAEGQGRLTAGEWFHFLGQARGSLYEVDANVIISMEVGFITPSEYEMLRKQSEAVIRPLAGLIRDARRRIDELRAKQKRMRRAALPTANR